MNVYTSVRYLVHGTFFASYTTVIVVELVARVLYKYRYPRVLVLSTGTRGTGTTSVRDGTGT